MVHVANALTKQQCCPALAMCVLMTKEMWVCSMQLKFLQDHCVQTNACWRREKKLKPSNCFSSEQTCHVMFSKKFEESYEPSFSTQTKVSPNFKLSTANLLVLSAQHDHCVLLEEGQTHVTNLWTWFFHKKGVVGDDNHLFWAPVQAKLLSICHWTGDTKPMFQAENNLCEHHW